MLSLIKKLFGRARRPAARDSQALEDGRYRKKIMVVDDDPVVLKALSLLLKAKGYKVLTAVDGSQAIGLMRDDRPDMMLVDVSFPVDPGSEWDGFGIAQWIRYMNRGLPTIMISGSYKPDYKRRAAAIGAQEFMIKPIDTRLLLGAIGKALGTRATVPTLKQVVS